MLSHVLPKTALLGSELLQLVADYFFRLKLARRIAAVTASYSSSVRLIVGMAYRLLSLCPSKKFVRPGLHQLGGPVGRSINLHKTDIKSLSSRDAARRAEVVRVVSSTISIKCPTRSIKASPTTR